MIQLQTIPHNVEVEQSFLGCILLDNEIIKDVKQYKSDIFYKEAHRLIYTSMLELEKENIPIDIVTLCEMMKSQNIPNDIISMSYITSLCTNVPSPSNYKHYLDILINYRYKREIIALSNQSINSAHSAEKGIEILTNIKNTLDRIEIISDENFIVDIWDIDDEDEQNVEKIATTFSELNIRLKGGYQFGALNVLAGWQGSGKSTLVNQMIIAESIYQGYKIFLYSGEMTANNILRWLMLTIANEDELITTSGEYGDCIKTSKECKFNIKEWLNDKLYLCSNSKNITLDTLIINMTNLVKKQDVRVFIIDNLLKFITSTNSKDEFMAQTEIVDRLKNFAIENNVLVHLVAHCKKTGDRSKPPTIEDISGTANISNLADYVTCIHRIPENAKEERDMDYDTGLYLYKNRHGSEMQKPLKMFFSEERKRFYTKINELNKDYSYNKFKAISLDD